MAKGNSLESLYITLGLDVSQLTSDFIAADKTVAENMAKINRESNLLKLRMQVDTGNLDPVKDAAQILAIKTQILNEQLAMQKDRVKMASAAWSEVSKKMGYTSTQTQKAEAAMLREKLAVQGLERELKQLNQTQQQSPTNKANSILTELRRYLSMRRKIYRHMDFRLWILKSTAHLQNLWYALKEPLAQFWEYPQVQWLR